MGSRRSPVKARPSATLRPRTQPPGIRRAQLMQAAEQLLLKRGIATTSVDQIVASADVAKGTFYLYFDSKEELLLALQHRFVADLCHKLELAMDRPRTSDWHGRLRRWLETAVVGYFEAWGLHQIVFRDFRPSKRRKKHKNPIVEQLANFLRKGHRAGAWSAEAPHSTAKLLFHALHGAIEDALREQSRVNPVHLARELELFFHRVLSSR
jgi:AcrR family transcriptional regulator